MTYEDIFKKVKTAVKNADVSKINERLVYQFTITGEGEGKFYAEIDGGALKLEPYDYNDCDAEFVASADNLLKLLKGELDPVLAFTLGKLKVNGNLDKALKLKDVVVAKKRGRK